MLADAEVPTVAEVAIVAEVESVAEVDALLSLVLVPPAPTPLHATHPNSITHSKRMERKRFIKASIF